MRLVLASNNAKKLKELTALLAGLPVELVAQGELGIPEAEEPHRSFVENALAKARAAARASGGAALADDSGLVVEALGGLPGVDSAHIAALPSGAGLSDRETLRAAQDAANNAWLLERLEALPDGGGERRAAFVSTLVALRHPDDPEPLIASGRWPGRIGFKVRGEGGFGYDPLFVVDERGTTAAELAVETKNSLSHRGRSAQALRVLMREQWFA
ncbi:MAG: non-canonical purine NTP pyrophosphatase [Rubrivivax sp.]|nr:non-canonical purine NTP pyrophosphatase [Rubrivivax sp.]